MKYLCLIAFEEDSLYGLGPAEIERLDRETKPFDASLRASGHFLDSDALEPTRTAKTVRRQSGKLLVTDGPFAETKEAIGGFLLIEAADMDEAIAIVSAMPGLAHGSVEIRPVRPRP